MIDRKLIRGVKKFIQQVGVSKILGLLFALILCIYLIFISAQPITLHFAVADDEYQYWKQLIEQFNNKYQNKILIKLQEYRDPLRSSNQLKEKYISSFEGKSPLDDLIYMDIIWVAEFAEKHWLLNLSEEFSQVDLKELQEDLKKEFLQSEVNNAYYEGGLYRIPFRTDLGVLYYRKDLLNNSEIQELQTFQDLKTISENLKKQKEVQWGYLWQGRQSEALAAMFLEVLHGFSPHSAPLTVTIGYYGSKFRKKE